jgi:hypothetical protein
MDRLFNRLVSRAKPLGNHARKYLLAIEQNGERLLARLGETGRLSRVHIDRTAPSLADDFDQVLEAASDASEAYAFLGTFYAIQFLHLNARSLERLAVDLAEQPDRREVFNSFLRRTDEEFTSLVSAYTRRVLRLAMPPGLRAPYLLCAVGTRGHQDDIDVAVIDEGGPARAQLDRAFAKLTGQMLRYASALDHYLAEHIGSGGICVSPDELKRALQPGRIDFVVITEMLRAQPLAGSRRLLRRVQREVVSTYYYHPGLDNLMHEIYLRGLLGEIRSLLLRPQRRDSINPKEDAGRLILGVALALKTIEGLDETRPRILLRQLRSRRPALRPHLLKLEESLLFLDTFHNLSQILVAHEDDFELGGEASRENLERVAATMGYEDRGPVGAVESLLVHYQEAVDAARSTARPVMEEVARHLAEISRFAGWTRATGGVQTTANLAEEFAAAGGAFRGARFWDDMLEAFGSADGRLLETFAQDYESLPAERRRTLALQYADWGRDAPYALLTLMVLLAKRASRAAEANPAEEITRSFLDRLGTETEDLRALSRVFRYYPDLVNKFLLTLERDDLERLLGKLDVPIGDPEVAAARDRFGAFIHVHRDASRYVMRVLARLTVRYPAVVLALSDETALRTLAQGRLAAGERHPMPDEQKDLLGDFYDMEFLRLALETLSGTPTREIRSGFADLTGTWLRSVFDVCLRQAEREAGRSMAQRDLLGIYLAGGHSRWRPFDEDYDLVALIDTADSDDLRIAERAIVLLNRQVSRRGVIAQYHLGDRLGHFVTTLDELRRLLESGADDLFVVAHQLINCQMIIGGPRIEEGLVEKVLRPCVFDKAEEFMARLAREARERREKISPLPEGLFHLKGLPGCFREIDLCLAASRARLGVRDGVEVNPFETLKQLDPGKADAYDALRAADEALVALRTVYRVCVAATDVIEADYLSAPARILGYDAGGSQPGSGAQAPGTTPPGGAGGPPARALLGDIRRLTGAAARAVDRILMQP